MTWREFRHKRELFLPQTIVGGVVFINQRDPANPVRALSPFDVRNSKPKPKTVSQLLQHCHLTSIGSLFF